MPPGQPLKVAVTGGIGVGKSTVSGIFEKLGAIRIDADQLAHQVLDEKASEIAEAFGHREWKKGINRKELAKIVFENTQDRIKLEKIVHPAVAEKVRQRFAELNSGEIVIYDVPLLEKSRTKNSEDGNIHYDIVVVVTAPKEERYQRLATRSGMTRTEVNQRIDAQISDTERIRDADIVIKNTGTKKELEQVIKNKLWPLLTATTSGKTSQ